MEINKFQKECTRTCSFDTEEELVYGLIGELGEVVDLLKKFRYHRHLYNKHKLTLELGDVLWYLNNLATMHDIDMTFVAYENISKLKERYPNGFNPVDSIRRIDVIE
ncbi:MAG: nucleoside triphosphate pyrophosphohydrolase family protein [Clostridium sp.]